MRTRGRGTDASIQTVVEKQEEVIDYDKNARRAVKNLSGAVSRWFEVIEKEEKGTIADIPALCVALNKGPQLFMFSCLSGDGETEELENNLGALFTKRWREHIGRFLAELGRTGCGERLIVFVDDSEPRAVWGWDKPQKDITMWYRMVVEDADIPVGWEVSLWSDAESRFNQNCCPKPAGECGGEPEEPDELNHSRLLAHARRFPNKKMKKQMSIRGAVNRRLWHCFRQGEMLRSLFPSGILIQSETPWAVKDLLYGQLRKSFPIIHPFPEERR